MKLHSCFRTFFPTKLAKHQKSCTKANPMTNPNRVKGVASRLESLVNYPGQKRRKIRNKETNEDAWRDNYSCNCSKEESCKDAILENDTPTLRDFIDVINDTKVLEDSEKSKQLLFLMTHFIKMKTIESHNMFPKIS